MSHYTFDSATNGWAWDTGITGATSGLSTAQAHSGTGSIGVTIGAATGTENLRVDFASPQNLTGMSLSFWIYTDTAEVNQISVFEQNTAYSVYEGGLYTTPTTYNLNHWIEYRYTFTGNGGNLASVNDLDIQFTSSGSGAGHVYVDDVTIAPAPTIWTYEDSTADAWQYGAIGSGVVSSFWNVIAPEGSGNASSYALTSPSATFNAINQTLQFQYNFSPAASFTALGISTISADVFISADISNNASEGAQVFIQSGGSYVWENSSYANITSGTWSTINFVPAYGTAGESAAQVQRIGVQFSTGGAGTAWGTGDLQMDNVQLH